MYLIILLQFLIISLQSKLQDKVNNDITPNAIDPSTYSNFDKIGTDNIYLKISVDFENSKLVGVVYHQMICK
jgi:hypothetical protein